MRGHLAGMVVRFCLLLTATGSVLSGCQDLDRVNPLDPKYTMELSLTGPDTIYSLNDTVRFTLATRPSHPELAFHWQSNHPSGLANIAPGVFVSKLNGQFAVAAELYHHRVTKTIVVQQRPHRMAILANGGTLLESLGEARTYSASVVDAKGMPITGTSAGAVTWTSSHPAVADVLSGRVTARANGTTWIRAQAGGQRDSVEVTVRQRLSSIAFSQNEYTVTGPNTQVQTSVALRDARGNLMQEPPPITWSSSRETFPVDATGRVQILTYGSATISAGSGDIQANGIVRVLGGTAPKNEFLRAGLTRFDAATASANFLFTQYEYSDPEADIDFVTFEPYNASGTRLGSSTFSVPQGFARISGSVTSPNAASVASVRMRAQDAARNLSSLTTAQVTVHPRTGSPVLDAISARRVGSDSLSVDVTVTDAQRDVEFLILYGFTSAMEIVIYTSYRLNPMTGATHTYALGTRDTAAGQVVRVGVLAADALGNLSLLRTTTNVTASQLLPITAAPRATPLEATRGVDILIHPEGPTRR